MNNDVLKYELGVNNKEEAKLRCLGIIENIRNVIDIKGLNYIETYILMADEFKN